MREVTISNRAEGFNLLKVGEWLGVIFDELISTPVATPKEISHYTDLNALRCIVENGELWLSNILFLNDSREMSYGTTEALGVLAGQANKNAENDNIFNSVQSRIADQGVPDAFACCFCEEADYLGQWRGYGTFGRNVSIQFETVALERQFDVGTSLRKVIYGQSRAREQLSQHIGKVLLQAQASAEESNIDTVAAVAQIEQLVVSLIPQFKHDAFQDEKEWRIVATGPSDDKQVHFRAAGHVLVPYIVIGDRGKKLPIKSITVGPGNDKETTKRSIENFLSAHPRYKDVKVVNSKIPFRV